MKLLKESIKFKQGFSLIEMLLYTALIGIFVGGTITIAWNVVYGGVKAMSQKEVMDNLNLVNKKLTYEIRNASDVVINSVTSITIIPQDSSRSGITFYLEDQKIMYGVDNGQGCSVSNACELTGNRVHVTGLNFEDLSAAGSNSKLLQFEIDINYNSDNTKWSYAASIKNSAETRSLK